jgi:uncharacterized integral membrane protein (TIGR00698 family)
VSPLSPRTSQAGEADVPQSKGWGWAIGPGARAAAGDGLPGLALVAAIAGAAVLLEMLLRGFRLPTAVIALLIGMVFHAYASHPRLVPGVRFSASVLLRIAVGLLGLKLSLTDVGSLGWPVALSMVSAMAATFGVALLLARMLGLPPGLAVLMGAANAVCGASATIAVAAMLPLHHRQGEVVLTVVLANAVSTLAMLAYPLIARWAEMPPLATGLLMGASIQDMAQVVGAVSSLPDAAANAGITVKMFRVFLLVPVVWLIGVAFAAEVDPAASSETRKPAPVRIPGFALAFVALCLINSTMPMFPAIETYYAPLRQALIMASNAALLMALAALGLGTSVRGITELSWRPIALFAGAALAILVFAFGLAALSLT